MSEMSVFSAASTWLDRDPEANHRAHITKLLEREDVSSLQSLFDGRIAFGTAGLRAPVGPGPLNINALVVQETALGLADYLNIKVPEAKTRGIIVGYDARIDSQRFAELAAETLAQEGFRVWMFKGHGPTPLAAFALQDLRAAAALVVTASHNPPEYNGIKVFWENGAQIVPPHDVGIAAAIDEAAKKLLPAFEEASRSRIEYLEASVLQRYEDSWPRSSSTVPLKIAYSAMHGVGGPWIERATRARNLGELRCVEAQHEADGLFPTVSFPNPEEPGAMDLVLALGKEFGADIAFANDPDADRLAVALPKDGTWEVLSGNQIGLLLAASCLDESAENKCVATTVVSSRMLKKIAESRGAQYVETLTGFKWIANTALSDIEKGRRFAFGYEEALGYCVGEATRDKDGISAFVAFAQLCSELKSKGQSVWDYWDALKAEFGVYLSEQISMRMDEARKDELMKKLRTHTPKHIGGHAVIKAMDYLDFKESSKRTDLVVFELESVRLAVRPSGTEPKLKCYYEAWGVDDTEVATRLKLFVEAHRTEFFE